MFLAVALRAYRSDFAGNGGKRSRFRTPNGRKHEEGGSLEDEDSVFLRAHVKENQRGKQAEQSFSFDFTDLSLSVSTSDFSPHVFISLSLSPFLAVLKTTLRQEERKKNDDEEWHPG